jgi:sigma-B regulation protein RsbU (phosphoserine phosphatase)
VNRILCRNSLNGRFVTMFYGEIDRLHQLIYTSAGHPGLALGDGRFTLLREGGPILGVNPNASYTRGTYSIGTRHVVCLFTDGISEAQSPSGELFGEERIRAYVRAHRRAGARELAEGVMAEVEAFSEGRQDDDRTIVIVKRREDGVAPDGEAVLPIEAGFRFD